MILLWVTLLLVHQGCPSVPVIIVQLGEPATLTCELTDEWLGIEGLHWYKQKVGDTLKLLTMLHKTQNPTYGPGVSASKVKMTYHEKISNLTIFRTTKEDEGMYHCAFLHWNQNTWRGIYLSIKGNKSLMDYTVVQKSRAAKTASSATLECSILSDSKNKTCPGGLSVFWYRARSHESLPEILFTDGINHANCTKKHGRKCVHSFFKNVSLSEFGTYYCAIAACGKLLFGNGTILELDKPPDSTFITLITIIICLIITVIAIICCQSHKKNLIKGHDHLGQQEDKNDEEQNDLNYAALRFSGRKATKGKKKKQMDESVYSQVVYSQVSI